jgi:hypothetical protein
VEISPRRTRRARRGKELIINTLRALRVLRGENGLLVAALLRCDTNAEFLVLLTRFYCKCLFSLRLCVSA